MPIAARPLTTTLASLLALLTLWVSGPLSAADVPATRLAFRAYNRDQGLGNLTVNVLLQDREGFIWVGTDGGVYRYDGDRFEGYGVDSGLASPLVNTICQDAGGLLWVGTGEGLSCRVKGRFLTVKAGLPPGTSVVDIAEGPGGELWLATRLGVFAGDARGGFHTVPGWEGGRAFSLSASPDARSMWVVSSRNLLHWQVDGGWRVVDEGGPAVADELDRVLADGDGNLWLQSVHHLWMLASGAREPVPVEGVPASVSSVCRMTLDRHGVLWAPNQKGLAYRENGRWTQLGLSSGLPTDFARAALVDHEGSLWVGSRGLFRIRGRGAWRSATPSDGLAAPVWSLVRDLSGTLFVGTGEGLYHHGDDGWQVVPGTRTMVVRSVLEAPDGSFLFAGEPAAVYRWDRRSGGVEAVIRLPDSRDRILRLLLDPEGRLWIATRHSGLLVARQVGGTWQSGQVDLPESPERETLFHLLLDRQGRLWAAGDGGLACRSGGAWVRYTRRDGLLDDHVSYLAETPSGELWVVYFDTFGLSRVRLEDGRLRVLEHVGAADGLASTNLYLIGLDARGRLWLGSEKGLDVLEEPGTTLRLRHFGLEDGLVDEETDAMAFLADANGDVWIGTRGGLARLDAGRLGAPPSPPATTIKEARLGSRVVQPDETGVRVSSRDNTLDVRFAGLSYLDEAAVRHEVRLIGLETEWTAIRAHETRYPGLAPGGYRLELRSRVGLGGWGPIASLSFSILPPWWQTSWARGAALIGLAALALAYGRLRTAILRRRARELEGLVAERTAELGRRTDELGRANEALENLSLTDSLTGLHNRRYLLVTIPENLAQVNRAYRDVVLRGAGRLSKNIDLMFLILDIDHFKEVNDRYGHGAGDKVLEQLAVVLTGTVRETDTVVRWGGEEFLLVARNACRLDAPILPARILSRVAANSFDIGDGQLLHCTCSIGFAIYPFVPARPDLFSWQLLLELADQCLFAAKHSGRNAWIGVRPSTGADPDEIRNRVPHDLEALVQQGMVEVMSSLAEPTDLRWSPIP